MSANDILVYSEYLSRIKSIAISIQLPSHSVAKKLTFKNVNTGILHYEDENHVHKQFVIHFPEDISVRVSESNYPISNITSSLSFRLPASPELSNVLQSKLTFYDNSNLIPWSADILNKLKLTMVCCGCDSVITDSNRIVQWKSLPSENWAEMMDFWHCHKPNDGDDKFNPSYAISKFVPYSKTGLVGDCYFYVTAEDVKNTEVMENEVKCAKCDNVLGSKENKSITIWKWNIKMIQDMSESVDEGKSDSNLPISYPLHFYVSTVLARLIDSHAIYTFSITDLDESPFLLLWVFNPDIKYTTTKESTKSAFKIVYCFDKNIMPSLEKTRNEIEKVKFPRIVLDQLRNHILENNLLLPENARTFGQWNVSMLEKSY